MLVLLPPSETKRAGGGTPFGDVPALSREDVLGEARSRVRAALVAVSDDEERATKALKLGVKNRDERLRNLELETSGAMPAIERYTGVLYDALGAEDLDIDARAWLDAHVRVQSALFGLVGAGEWIPAYRLSGSSRLPELGSPLARVWAPAHEGVLVGCDYVLDLRSKDYAGLAPLAALGAAETDFVEVVARGDDGEVRALNHFNKAAKGDLVRRLAESGAELTSRDELLAWAHANDIELVAGDAANTLRLVTAQGVPASNR